MDFSTLRRQKRRRSAPRLPPSKREICGTASCETCRTAWLAANTSYQRVSVTAELLQEANLGLTLAQTRYQMGLSSIVELSQAEYQQTDAAIGNANAQYQYRMALATLNYQIGSDTVKGQGKCCQWKSCDRTSAVVMSIGLIRQAFTWITPFCILQSTFYLKKAVARDDDAISLE